MRIQHHNPATSSVSHGGKEYEGQGDGVVDLPDDVADHFLRSPHWRPYFGESWAAPKTAEEIEADRLEVAISRALETANRKRARK